MNMIVARLRRFLHRSRMSDRMHAPIDEVIRGYPGPRLYTVLSCSCGEVFFENLPKELKQTLEDVSNEVPP